MKKIIFTFLIIHCSLLIAKAQWMQQNSGTNQNLYDIEFINEKTGWAVGDAGVVIKTTDGGTNWLNVPNPSGQYGGLLWSVCPVDSEVVYVVAGYDFIMKTSDGGSNWNILKTCLTCNSAIVGLHFMNRDTGWFLGTYKVLRTYDGGITLDSFYAPWFDNFDIYFKDMSTGIFCGVGRVFKSTDGGMNWLNTNVTGSFSFFTKLGIAGENVWVGGGGKIYKSSNFCDSWIISDSSLGALAIAFINEDTGFVGGSNNILYRSTNGGFNWYRQRTDSSSSAFISSIEFVNELTGWYSCGLGKIYKTTTGGEILTNIVSKSEPIPTSFLLHQNYPNPFNNQTIIEFEIGKSSYYRFEIFNLLGQRLDEVFYKFISSGKHKIFYNSEKLSSGIFIYRLSSERYSVNKKFILLQ